MCRDDVSSPFVEGSRLQRLRESIGPLFIRGHKYQADAPMVVFMPDVVHRVAEMFVARCYTWIGVRDLENLYIIIESSSVARVETSGHVF